jgi:hypothetical protein
MTKRIVYYATTATQSKTTVGTIVCAVSMPAELSIFRQQAHALKMARAQHPNAAIRGVVERGKLSVRIQEAAAKVCPMYRWELPEVSK